MPASDQGITLSDFGVAFGSFVALSDLNLVVQNPSMTVLMGPAGSGKSTLVRTLAGLNAAQPAFRTWGTCTLPERAPALVRQRAQLYLSSVRENLLSGLPDRSLLTRTEQEVRLRDELKRFELPALASQLDVEVNQLSLADQRIISISRVLLSQPSVLMVDEPTSTLTDAESQPILDLLARQSEERAVIIVTHHQARARRLGGTMVLIAAGTAREVAPVESFFREPSTAAGKQFVRTGGCEVPSPNASPEDLAPGAEPPPKVPPEHRTSRYSGPNGFYWLISGQLGGAPRPGVTVALETDLEALKRTGATRLVNLEEEVVYSLDAVREKGLDVRHFPVVDMDAPDVAAAKEHCAAVEAELLAGEVVVVHCRAGLGRTGTMLTAQLIWRGQSAPEAVEQSRSVNPRWIQSDTQLAFLDRFGKSLRGVF